MPGICPDFSSMSSAELGRYGRGLQEQNADSGVRHVIIARVLYEARHTERHQQEGMAFDEWTRRYFGFGEQQAVSHMGIRAFPLEAVSGQELSWHQLKAAEGCEGAVLAPLLSNMRALAPARIARIKRAGTAWVRQGLPEEEVAALVRRTARGELALSEPLRRPSALPSGRLGRGQVLKPMRGVLKAVEILRERRLRGEVFAGTWPEELREAMRSLLWQMPDVLGEDPEALVRELLAERRASSRTIDRPPIRENGEISNDRELLPEESVSAACAEGDAEGAGVREPAGVHLAQPDAGSPVLPAESQPDGLAAVTDYESNREDCAGPTMNEVIAELPEVHRAWLGERLFAILRGDASEDTGAALGLMFEGCYLAAIGVSRAYFERWLATLCDHADPAGCWDRALEWLWRAELPGFREQLYLLRTYPLTDTQRAQVLRLCGDVALYPRGSGAQDVSEGLPADLVDLLLDLADLKRLQAQLEANWSDEEPLSIDVQCRLFEEQMALEKAVRDLGHAQRRW